MSRSIISFLVVPAILSVSAAAWADTSDSQTSTTSTEATPNEQVPTKKPASPSKAGPTFELRLGMLAPTGKSFDGTDPSSDMSSFGMGAALQPMIAYHFTPNVALAGGLRLTDFHKGADGWCGSGAKCSGTTLQIPIVFRYAAESRLQGFYFEGGLGFLTRYNINVKAGSSEGSITFANDVLEAKLGVGYRIPAVAPGGGLDIFMNVDMGEFKRVDAEIGGKSESGEIQKSAFHNTFTFGVAGTFAP